MSATARARLDRRWRIAVTACAVLVALIVLSPVARFRLDAGDAYRGIWFHGASDGEQYITQLRRAAEGSYGARNEVLYEGRLPGMQADVVPHRLGNPMYLVGYPWLLGDLHAYVVLVTGLCAAAHLVLFTAIGRALRLSRPVALAAALACCLAPWLWSFEGGGRWLFAPERPLIDFLPLYRPVNPSFSSLFVWGALLLGIRWLRRPRWWIVAALTAIAAVSADVYLPAFTVIGGILGATALLRLVAGRRTQGLALLGGGALALAVNAGTVLNLHDTGAAATAAVQGNQAAVPFRDPLLTWDVASALAVSALALLVPWRRRLRPEQRLVALGLPLVLLAVFNAHLVTGRIYQPFHYDWFYTVPAIWLALAVALSRMRGLLPAIRAALSRPAVRTACDLGEAAAALLVLAFALAGPVSGRVLRAIGAIRADELARPGLFAALGLAAVGCTWGLIALLRSGRPRTVRTALCLAAAAAAVIEGVRVQDDGYRTRRPEHLEFQRVAPALDWIAQHADKDAVVMCGNGGLPRLVTSYTGRNVLISLEAMFAPYPPEEEFLERRFIWLATYGIPPETLAAELGDKGRFHFDLFKWRTFGPPPPKISFLTYGRHTLPLAAGDAERIVEAYRKWWAMPAAQRFARYRLDYVMVTDLDGPAGLGAPAAEPPLSLAFESPGVKLYRVGGP